MSDRRGQQHCQRRKESGLAEHHSNLDALQLYWQTCIYYLHSFDNTLLDKKNNEKAGLLEMQYIGLHLSWTIALKTITL